MKLNNKVVWITGASSGIGEALAYELAKRNCQLVISARRQSELERVKVQTGLSDENILVLPLDLAEHGQLIGKANKVLNKFNKLDCIIHNGGISQRSLAVHTSFDVDKQLMSVNYLGAVALTKAVLPFFQKQQSGHFVVMSSLAGKFGTKLRSAYCASKHALHGFFESLRCENWDKNIGITIVCGGFINTNVSINAMTGDGSKHDKQDETHRQGISPQKCAIQIINAVEKNKEEIYVGGKEILAIYAKRFFPKWFSNKMKKLEVN